MRRLVRSTHVVIDPPTFDSLIGFFHRIEPAYVQTLVAEQPVERFDEAVVDRRTGSAEVNPNPTMIGPEVEHPTRELAAVVREDAFQCAAMEQRGPSRARRRGFRC